MIMRCSSTATKFRFCGDGDCPDWVLAEIIATLSNMSVTNLEQLSVLVAKRLSGDSFEESTIKSLTADVSNDGKTAVACVDYLLSNAARFSCSNVDFGEEIQQLGLPKDHAMAMCRVLSAHCDAIQNKLKEKSFKINELLDVRNITGDAGVITPSNCITLELKVGQELIDGLPVDTTHTMNIEEAQVKALLAELKIARDILLKYENKN